MNDYNPALVPSINDSTKTNTFDRSPGQHSDNKKRVSRSSLDMQRQVRTMNKQERWLHEHLSYELLMVRHAHKELQVPVIRSACEQLVWNANFGAFAMYARNLYDFLTNEAGPRNFVAKNFAAEFEADKTPLVGIMNNLNEQAFHPGKQRTPSNDKRRVGLVKVNTVYAWVETNMQKFLGQLKQPYNTIWDQDMADLAKITKHAVPGELPQDTSSSHPGMWRIINF
jgi:hypothetical protein